MKVIIVGGVAGGASCAARLRRLDERAEIVLVEGGPCMSYANCWLPYHIGGVIERESALPVASAQQFGATLDVDVRVLTEAVDVDPAARTVQLRDVGTGEVSIESYDALVLSPGARTVRPPIPGIDLPGVFEVRTVPDARAIREWIARGTTFLTGMDSYSGWQTVRPRKHAVVVGGGFIGLEIAENLARVGFGVTVVEMADQVLLPLDPEFGRIAADRLEQHGVRVVLGDGVASFEAGEGRSAVVVTTRSGAQFPADVVVVSLGVRPDTALARAAGLEIGERGGIRVDDQMRTSDRHIFAVGAAVEVKDVQTGRWTLMALGGPANRQGRIAAEVICGRDSRFRGVQGTAVIGLFGSTLAWTGQNERSLVRGGDGLLLGAQAAGEDGVDKRIGHLAMAIPVGVTVHDLEESELCCAPQFGSAKDPVNVAGMVAADVLRGDMPLTLCRSAQRAYYATRVLVQNGFKVKVVSGGMLSHPMLAPR